MKVTAFNGSPRKNGNTGVMINAVFEELNKEDIETEIVYLPGKNIYGCIACMVLAAIAFLLVLSKPANGRRWP